MVCGSISFAAIAITIFMRSRLKLFGGEELGGLIKYRLILRFLFVLLWIVYLVLSGLVNYCHIDI